MSTSSQIRRILKNEARSYEDNPTKEGIRWGELTLFEFPNLLGDNPAVSNGSPLTIGWKHVSRKIYDIDYYEYLRETIYPRRQKKELLMASAARDTYLLGLGYSLDELIQASEETRKVRKKRYETMKGNSWSKFRKTIESARKSILSGPNEPKTFIAKCG